MIIIMELIIEFYYSDKDFYDLKKCSAHWMLGNHNSETLWANITKEWCDSTFTVIFGMQFAICSEDIN